MLATFKWSRFRDSRWASLRGLFKVSTEPSKLMRRVRFPYPALGLPHGPLLTTEDARWGTPDGVSVALAVLLVAST